RIPDSTPLPFPAAETQPAREARKQSGNRPHVEKGEDVATTDSRKIRARRKQRRRKEEGPHQVASVSCRPGRRHRSPRTAKLTPPPTLSSRVQSRDPYPCNKPSNSLNLHCAKLSYRSPVSPSLTLFAYDS